ncbi:hypothetical protein DJ030_17750 [bacterium endosymbiont of Escarpia laminata]|nr:MAG: hypothetical protein DJ030_17750 [bacterium endosymbiont of Escarpia laminata]RLJ18293.1 MAG: hypothetical protein DJ031_11545 [bacterium endosymbiont of Escarpia laminata]
MKYLLPILLLPAMVFAQSPQGQMDREQMFKMAKQRMLPVMETSIPAMKKTLTCLEGTSSKDDLMKCVAIMTEAREQAMRSIGGGKESSHGKPPLAPDPKDIEWSPEMKVQMVKDLKLSIKRSEAIKGCLGKSASSAEMDSCMQSAAK